MRSLSLLVAVTGVILCASHASAQCYYIAPPHAPDMRNPGFYYSNCYGVIYGPNYYVRPNFPPYQGVIPGPPRGKQPHQFAQYTQNPQAFTAAMEEYYKKAKGSFGGFPRHLYARSPRDYFMVDTDPQPSPYNYGFAGSGGLSGARGDGCND